MAVSAVGDFLETYFVDYYSRPPPQPPTEPPSGMEETVGNIRKELWVWQDNIKGYRHKVVDVYRTSVQQASCK